MFYYIPNFENIFRLLRQLWKSSFRTISENLEYFQRKSKRQSSVNFTSVLNILGGVVKRVHGFVGGVNQTLAQLAWVAWIYKILARVKKNAKGQNFGVGETYDFMNFPYDSIMNFYLSFQSLLCILYTRCIVMNCRFNLRHFILIHVPSFL